MGTGKVQVQVSTGKVTGGWSRKGLRKGLSGEQESASGNSEKKPLHCKGNSVVEMRSGEWRQKREL